MVQADRKKMCMGSEKYGIALRRPFYGHEHCVRVIVHATVELWPMGIMSFRIVWLLAWLTDKWFKACSTNLERGVWSV